MEPLHTGLALGLYATVFYWASLVMLSLVVAYFVAVKRVHAKTLSALGSALFGGTARSAIAASKAAQAAAAVPTKVELPQTTVAGDTDEFLMAQILRRV
jgi:hypothetical protein